MEEKSIVQMVKERNPTYKEMSSLYKWLEEEFRKSHERSMEPEKYRNHEPWQQGDRI